jgi:hypothetical protein
VPDQEPQWAGVCSPELEIGAAEAEPALPILQLRYYVNGLWIKPPTS